MDREWLLLINESRARLSSLQAWKLAFLRMAQILKPFTKHSTCFEFRSHILKLKSADKSEGVTNSELEHACFLNCIISLFRQRQSAYRTKILSYFQEINKAVFEKRPEIDRIRTM